MNENTLEKIEERDIDKHFGALIADISHDETLGKIAALASSVLGHGHVCVDPDIPVEWPDSLAAELPPAREWKKVLSAHPESVSTEETRRPLVYDGKRLYLHRYWHYQQQIVLKIRLLLSAPLIPLSEKVLQKARDWFAIGNEDLAPYGGHLQLAAALLPFFSGFAVISGGPGTGKTTVLAKTLALFLSQRPDAKIALAAPTGKAAVRMNDSIAKSVSVLDTDSKVIEKLPELEAMTIHRLLGYQHGSPYFRHNENHHLNADLVVVDESSMVDLALMAKLMDALKPDARLMLLGDMYQLASVEAGSVLADICEVFPQNDFSTALTKTAESLIDNPHNRLSTGTFPALLQNRLVVLQKSYRFQDKGEIGRAARMINEGHADAALQILGGGEQCSLLSPNTVSYDTLIRNMAESYRGLHNARTTTEALKRLGDFKVLTALRRGKWGAEGINTRLEKIFSTGEEFYENRPVMILQNSPAQNLYNGDTGVIRKNADGQYRAYFLGHENSGFIPLILPEYSTAYAMTIHKSQGSEFREVLTVLPPEDGPFITKELIYTALTRARERAVFVANESVLRAGILRRTERVSGLADALRTGIEKA